MMMMLLLFSFLPTSLTHSFYLFYLSLSLTVSGKPLHFKGTIFHRVIKSFMMQGGDIEHKDGRYILLYERGRESYCVLLLLVCFVMVMCCYC